MTTKESKNLFERIDRGIRKGVADALREHKKAGIAIAVWENGRVKKIPPEKIRIQKV